MKEDLTLQEKFTTKVEKAVKEKKLSGIGKLLIPRFWNPIFMVLFIVSFIFEVLYTIGYTITVLGKIYYNILKERKNYV